MTDQPLKPPDGPILDYATPIPEYAKRAESLFAHVNWRFILRIGIGLIFAGLFLMTIFDPDIGFGVASTGVGCFIIGRAAANTKIHLAWRILIGLATIVWVHAGAELFYNTGFNFVGVYRRWDIYRLEPNLLEPLTPFLCGLLAAAAFRVIAWSSWKNRSHIQDTQTPIQPS
jgi:hypothetical protein